MTVAIRYEADTGRITNRYFGGAKNEAGWVNTDDSEWPDPNVARDELPVYYYDNDTGGITVQGDRQVIEGTRVTLDDGQVINDGADMETVTVTLVNDFVGPETPFDDIAVLNRDDDVTVTVDGSEMAKTLSNGTLSFDVTTEKSSSSTINITVKHPDVDDTATETIEVVTA